MPRCIQYKRHQVRHDLQHDRLVPAQKVTIRATVTDMGANVVAGSNLVGTWAA